ncbi:MAG: A24 family peptidase [Candidatus Acidiferrales bacterium]|jgi:prepilin peptidase CpaA
MDTTTKIWAIALVVGLVAGWIDWRTRRIPNWLTVSGVIGGIAIHTYVSGWIGAFIAILGVVAAMIILLPCVLLRAMGAGDWKLMAALGSILGPLMMLFVLVAAIFLAGLMALFMVVRAKRVKETFCNIYVLVQGFFTFGLRANPDISLDNPALMKLPFGVAAAGGTVLCFLATRWTW